jgi:hypothetical protein
MDRACIEASIKPFADLEMLHITGIQGAEIASSERGQPYLLPASKAISKWFGADLKAIWGCFEAV